MDRRKPFNEGLQFLMTTVGTQKRLPKRELRLGAAESLSVLAADFAFFTPAILYLNEIVNDDPLMDFQLEYGRVVTFYWTKFEQPFFRGLEHRDGDKDWNHALWALDRIHWAAFKKFYSAIVVFNEPRHLMYEVGVQELDIPDRLCRTGAQVIPITAFGINGNKVQVGFETYPQPWLNLPHARRFPPATEVVVFADALKLGVNPHAAREAFLRKAAEAPRER